MQNLKDQKFSLIVCAFFVCTILLAMTTAFSKQHESRPPSKLTEMLPSPVQKLFSWPDTATLEGPKRVPADAKEIKFPRKQTQNWLQKVMAESWLPEGDVPTVFLQNEFDGRDVVRMCWKHEDWDIQVSQTASIFTIKLIPSNGSGTGTSPEARVRKAQKMCLKIFAKEGRRWGRQGDIISVKNLNKKIAQYIFKSGKQFDFVESIGGRGKTMEEAGVRPPKSTEQTIHQRRADNPDWDKTAHAWQYWFRMVAWWNDGEAIGFYFLKKEGGAWMPNYEGNIDRDWFKLSRDRSGSSAQNGEDQ